MQDSFLKKLNGFGILDLSTVDLIDSKEAYHIKNNFLKNQRNDIKKYTKLQWEEYEIIMKKYINYLNINNSYNLYVTLGNYFHIQANTYQYLNLRDKQIIEDSYTISIVCLIYALKKTSSLEFKKNIEKILTLIIARFREFAKKNEIDFHVDYLNSKLRQLGVIKKSDEYLFSIKISHLFTTNEDITLEVKIKELELKEKFTLGNKSYLDGILIFLDFLKQTIDKLENKEDAIGIGLIGKFHYFSMRYDYFWLQIFIKDSSKKEREVIDEYMHRLKIIPCIAKQSRGKEYIPDLEYWGSPYWIHNTLFLNTNKYHKLQKYSIELICTYITADRNVRKGGIKRDLYKYLDIIHDFYSINGLATGRKQGNKSEPSTISNLYYLTQTKLNLLKLGFGVKHTSGDIFKILDDKFLQILNDENNDWMEEQIQEINELREKKKAEENRKQNEYQKKIDEENKIWDELKKLETLHREFKSGFCVKPDLIILGLEDTSGEKISKGGSFGWLEAIVEFLNTEGGDLYVGIWEIEAAAKKGISKEKIRESVDKGLIYIGENVPSLIIMGIEHDLNFENIDIDYLTRKINDSIKKYIISNPFEAGDSIEINYLSLGNKIICKMKVPKGKNYYHLKHGEIEKFFIRINNQKETLGGYKMSEYIRKNHR